MAQAGFTAVWLPPVLKDERGSTPAADGYSPFDDYDIGSRNQRGGIPTRFGKREDLQRCVAVLRGNGIDVYLDMVEHHRKGDIDAAPFVFNYPGAGDGVLGPDGKPVPGRFPKVPNFFVPQVPRDPNLGGPVSDDAPFGRELAPINGLPLHTVADQLTAAADWLTRALDVQGYRLDDAKGLSTDFLFPFLNNDAMAGKFAVGEFFDGNRTLVNGWVSNPKGMQGRSSAFDFPLKFILTAMCNNPGRFNMADLDHAGLVGISPMKAVTFVENHDTDLKSDQKIVTNKIQAYAYILTSEGYPCVFYRDYSDDPGCYALKLQIDNLIWIHEKIAAGETQARWKDFNVFAYERMGGSHLLVALNNDATGPHTITVATGFGPGVTLHDYTGHARGDVTTDAGGAVTITIPANSAGKGYVCYSVKDIMGDFTPTAQVVNQDFEGASDLDILPALPGKQAVNDILVGRIWSGANQPIKAILQPDASWTPDVTLILTLSDPEGTLIANLTTTTRDNVTLQAVAGKAGFYRFQLGASDGNGDSLIRSVPFKLSVRYQADPVFVPEPVEPDPAFKGKWGSTIQLENVPIHAHLLPNRKVLYWGRREVPGKDDYDSLNEHQTFPFLFDLESGLSKATDQPMANPEVGEHGPQPINLFCSSHTFLPDGRLLVTGGHYFDSQGIEASTIYDYASNTWMPGPVMGVSTLHPEGIGRWYPTVVTLYDGTVAVFSGQSATPNEISPRLPKPPNFNTPTNNMPEHWMVDPAAPWTPLNDFKFNNGDNSQDLTLFPRIHLAPDGRLFMSGTSTQSFFFDTANLGTWTTAQASRLSKTREYAPSVMYDVGQIIYIGGGNNSDSFAPTSAVEIIDLNDPLPTWIMAQSMHFARRQHNATILPDGTVLVTGGSRGPGFNDVSPGMPVHTAELWDPATGNWTLMDDEDVDRCYHSTAVLLPDATVLSGGGGEYQPDTRFFEANDAVETHANAQIFSPPYLFRGDGTRPTILQTPAQIAYGRPFNVAYQEPVHGKVVRASMVRLSSVTHSFNQNQRINFLEIAANPEGGITLTAPPNEKVCPPGHYMLFLLSDLGVPSIAQILQITGNAPALPRIAAPITNPVEAANQMQRDALHNPVSIGLTSTCPYGCWGNALSILHQLQDVAQVSPIADSQAWMVNVYLDHDGLPNIEKWREQITQLVLGSYAFRGVEVTLEGPIELVNGVLTMPATAQRPAVTLTPIRDGELIQLRAFNGKGAEHNPTADEAQSYGNLFQLQQRSATNLTAAVTGPLQISPVGPIVKIREYRTP